MNNRFYRDHMFRAGVERKIGSLGGRNVKALNLWTVKELTGFPIG